MSFTGKMKAAYGYRHLLYSMVARNLKGRYKSSYLGFAWHFIAPAITIIIFYVVFTGIRAAPIENYWAFLCIGMFPFTFFQMNLGAGANCLVSEAGTIKKMYFPREIVVFAHIISTFITFIMAYLVIMVLMLLAGLHIGVVAILYLPPILLLSVLFATGYTLFFSAITVFVKDVHHFVDAVSRLLLFMTPVFYLTSEVSGVLEKLIWRNPFTYYIESYHDILYRGIAPDLFLLGMCALFAAVALVVGYAVFSKLKGRFAEAL